MPSANPSATCIFTVGSAILLVILVIFVFLGDWRTTIIHFIATPVSLIGTFTFIKLLGFSINTLTLFGITLATGLVVDDVIVVIENIERHLQEGETSAAKAASAAMREVTGAVIATSLVLVAVFVPVAFFPGTTGILFRQFALTIAFSITISAFNALTLAPALAAILLGRIEHHQKNWFFRQVDRALDAINRGYVRALRTFLRFEVLALILFAAGLGLAYFVFTKVPQGFVPSEDQGYLIVAIQAPTGASLEYTRDIGRQVSAITKNIPEVQGTFSIAGFSFGGATPNAGLVFLPLRPYGKREGEEHSAAAILNRLRGPLFGISGAIVIPFEPPAVQGLGQFGGFQYELLDQGAHTLQDLDKITHDLIRAAGQRPQKDVTGLFTTYTANDPQYVVTIDREKAKSLHIPLSQITDTLGVYMGSSYVNDFDFNNRSYRVYVQADKQFRSHPQDIGQYYVRSDSGAMVPLENLVTITQSTRAPSHQSLQSFPFRGNRRLRLARLQLRPGHRRHATALGKDLAPGLHLRVVGNFAGRIRLRLNHAHPLWPRNPGRLSHALPRCMKVLFCPSLFFSPCPWLCSARSARNGSAACKTTSTARSDSSCSSASPPKTPS